MPTAEPGTAFALSVLQRAAANPRTIVFPEAGDARTVSAVRKLQEQQTLTSVLLGEGEDVAGVERIIPAADARLTRVAELLHTRRAAKGLTEDEALALARQPLFFADGLV
ncbi:MAG: phosphate acyltransferase, partial [Gemmatimonadaceae bacterium]